MKLFIYLPKGNGSGKKLVEISEKIKPDGPITLMRTFRQLATGLRQPLNNRDVIILYLPNRRQLAELLLLAPLLERVRVIIILPDQDPETIALGHQLRPRFLAVADQHFRDVAAVLKKMQNTAGPAHLET